MEMNIHIRDVAGIYPAGTVQVGDTALAIAADQQGVHLDLDASILGDDVEAALDTLLRLTARPVYAWTDRYDSAQQRLVELMQARGAINNDSDNRFFRWEISDSKGETNK